MAARPAAVALEARTATTRRPGPRRNKPYLAYFTAPFRAMIDVPFQIFLGTITGPDVALQIGTQVLWAVALGGTASLMIARGIRRVEVQGG